MEQFQLLRLEIWMISFQKVCLVELFEILNKNEMIHFSLGSSTQDTLLEHKLTDTLDQRSIQEILETRYLGKVLYFYPIVLLCPG